MPKLRQGFSVFDALEPVVLAFAIFMIVYMFLFQPHKVDGNSMYPTFHDKEYLLTDKITYWRRKPGRGDVVVFHAPPPNDADFIKRIVGLPGETIMVRDSRVYINDRPLYEAYLPPVVQTVQKSFLREGVPYPIPPDYYMVLGDNRNFSSDSREWGPVKTNTIVGRATFRYWPPTAGVFGFVSKPNYN